MHSETEKKILHEQLEGLYQVKLELIKKQTSLQLTIIKQSDANQEFSTNSNLEEVEEKIEKISKQIADLKTELNKIEVSLKSNTDTPNSNDIISRVIDKNDIANAIEVLMQDAKELGYNSTKEDIAKIHGLRIKISDELSRELDNQLAFITSKKELMYSSVLFDTIYTSETLDQVTASEIQKIREDNENYKWYDRSVLVSALSLSLINFKFDTKKANLLLDFVTDVELGVWERALTGLTLAIIYQKNRSWMRATTFINRIRTLQNNNRIQDGLKAIDFILKNELYKATLFHPSLFKMDLFKNPMNCFVPFYENNVVLKTAIDTADNEFNIEEFQEFLNTVPLMDSHKYVLCIKLIEEGLKKEKLSKNAFEIVANSLMLSDKFSPFQNIISEYYCFFNYFPEKKVDDVFRKQLLLSRTPLKEFILNKVMQLLLDANTLYKEKKYAEAIRKYQDLLKIDTTHKEANWQLANCYRAKGEDKKALSIYLVLEKELGEKTNIELLFRVATCYNILRESSKSIEYCEKISTKVKYPSFNHLCLMAENYEEQDDYRNAEIYCKRAEDKISDEDDCVRVAQIYSSIKKYNTALLLTKKALETKTDIADYWQLLGGIYCDLFEWDMSISSLTKAIELDTKNPYYHMSLGRSYLLSNTNLIEAKNLLEKALKSKSDCIDITYGNLGHLYLIQGDNDTSFNNYVECIKLLKSEKEFSKKMDLDLKFMTRIGIDEGEYNAMKVKVIEHFTLNKKK